MRTRLSTFARLSVLLAAVATLWVGCDSSDDSDEVSDADRFVGTWNATSLTLAGTGVNLLPLAGIQLRATFGPGSDARVVVTRDGVTVEDVSGTFSVDENAGNVTLSGGGFQGNLVMGYTFNSDDELQLTFSGADLENLGIDLGEFGAIIGQQPISAVLARV